MKLPPTVALTATCLLGVAESVAAQANREPSTDSTLGAIWGAGVWIGITVLLVIAVIIFAYQAAKRPNKN
jgi:hypothetical protein